MRHKLKFQKLFIIPLILLIILPAACQEKTEPPAVSKVTPDLVSPTATLLPTPTIAPTATSAPWPDFLAVTVSQANLDNFPPQALFAMQFNQPMDPDSAALPLLVSPFMEGRFAWDTNGTHLTYQPDEGFAPGGDYTLTLDSSLSAVSGLAFSQLQQWDLHIATAPQVASQLPEDLQSDNRHPTFELSFDRTMDKESVAEALAITPPIPFNITWENNTLLIAVSEPLAPGANYQFTLDQSAIDTQGIALDQVYQWGFQAEKLIANSTTPSANRRGEPISIHFNYKMNTESVGQAIQFKPNIIGDLTWSDDQKTATFTPASLLPAGSSYLISFDGPLLDANGELFPNPEAIQFTTPPPVVRKIPAGNSVHPATPIEITFDRPVDEVTTAASFHITPTLPGKISWRETSLIFMPDAGYLEPHSQYTVTIDTIAMDANDEPLLTEPYAWSFTTGNLEGIANFGWGPNAQVLDVNGRRAVQFQLFQPDNSRTITLELYRLNLTQFLDRYASGFRGVAGWENDRPISTQGTALIKSWEAELVDSVVEHINIQETIIPEDVPPGLYILNLKSGFVNDQLILLLSRNTVMVKQAGGQIFTWVSDINGGPVSGIDVEIYARDGELINNGRTDDHGVFQSEVSLDPQPLIIIARDGEDITASGLSNEWRSSGSQWWGWWLPAPTPHDYAAFIYTDRPIYRPGQPVFFKSILRRDDDAILNNLPEGTPVTVRIRDARNNVVQTFQLTTNSFGTINGSFQLGDGAMLGEYAVEIEINGESYRQEFKVEDYRKPDYQVTVETNKDRFIQGEMIEVTVDTAYFFGEPVPDADIEINLFKLAQQYWWVDSGEGDYTWFQSYDTLRQGRTDANGRFTFSFRAEMDYQSQRVDWQSNLEQMILGIEATVDDGSHQTVSGFAIVKMFNTGEKVRLNNNGYFHEPGQAFTVQAEVNTIDDRPVAGRSLNLTLRRWGRMDYEFTIIMQSLRLTSDSNGRATTSMTIEEPGYYQIRLDGTDERGNYIEFTSYIYAFSDFYSSWYGSGSDLNINVDKESYAPGDTAQLIIESTFSGPALLTFERGTTRREQLIELAAPITMVGVTIQPDDTPNIHVTVNAWKAHDTTLTQYSYESQPDSRMTIASVNLSVPVTDKTLKVDIISDKEIYQPREEATITVRVTNQEGTPVSAELSLAMVDEAIFALSDDLSGPIFDAFYYERDNAVLTFDALALSRYLGGGMGGGGGGGDLAGNPRSDFPDTAEWFPILHTDFKGEATVTLTLPDSLTSWRLTARAATADTQVGETFTNILTQQDIIVRPILPRTLTDGDQVNLSAIIHNYSQSAKTIDVKLLVDDTQWDLDDSLSSQTITIQPGGIKLVGWPLTAVAAGETLITIQANVAGQTQDAVQLPLNIRPLAIPDVTTQAGQFRSELATTINLPADALPMSGVRLELSRSIAGTLLEGLEYLTGFPYGCVEQTMSKALPNAVVGRALFQLGITNPTLQADLPAKINAGLQRLYGYQHNDGGWGWWYDDSSHDYQTAWVIFGLSVMADAGYEVDESVIQRGVDWLNENLSGMDIRTRAYALYSMAVAGQANLDETLLLVEQLDELDTFSRAGLALALHEAGQQTKAREIVDLLAQTAVVGNDGKVYWSGTDYDGSYGQKTMASDVRNTALVLSAFTQIRPGHELEGGIVRWLMGQRRQQGWGTTNETSYAILGLTDHLLATSFSESATDNQYTIFLNNEPIASGKLGRGEPAVSIEISAAQMKSGLNQLRVTQSGSGRLYYVINSRVYLAQEEIKAAGVIRVNRVYLDVESGKEIETAEPGQLVEVRLTVTLPNDASYIMVEDSLPGGLEALNEGLNNTSHIALANEYEEPYYFWQEYGYNYKEIRGDQVTFFITEMNKGRRTFSYIARVTHSGQFVAMPAEVSAMYDLATWGRSASAQFIVKDGTQ